LKITDFALIFIGITLPIMIIVYINVSYTIKAEEQEMYYKKIINQAVQDATKEMKEVESKDADIDYGYSGTANKKVSVNSQVAVDTFLNSLYNNFGIMGNDAAEKYLQLFVPAIAIVDYNGVQVSSIENYVQDGQNVTKHTVKPKRYYTYSYSIMSDGSIKDGIDFSALSVHTIEYTMDDYITHRGSYKYLGSWVDIPVKSFYITDEVNNQDLVSSSYGNSSGIDKAYIVDSIRTKRKEIIAKTVTEEMGYAVNSNNSYARAAGITYNFVFPTTTQDEMYSTVENVGMIAFVQGLSIGNKYLNTKAYAVSKLDLVTKYYLTVPSADSRYKMNLYHKDTQCPEYILSTHDNITPYFVITKQQAASAKATIKVASGENQQIQGFYPCPICNP
jgi:hypothetical protein